MILEPKKIKSLTVSIVCPSICYEVTGPDAMILVFLMLGFKPAFSLSYFIKRLLSSSLFSDIWVMSSAYLRLLIFLLAILIPACASSSLAFHVMYSANKLNKQHDNIQPWHAPWSRRSRDTWSDRQVWPWSTKWNRAKANKGFAKRRHWS